MCGRTGMEDAALSFTTAVYELVAQFAWLLASCGYGHAHAYPA